MAFAISLFGASVAPSLGWELLALLFAGAAITGFTVEANAMLQLNSPPEFRGRVLALRAIVFFGIRPLGAPIVGWIGERYGARNGLLVGSVVALAVSIWTATKLGNGRSEVIGG